MKQAKSPNVYVLLIAIVASIVLAAAVAQQSVAPFMTTYGQFSEGIKLNGSFGSSGLNCMTLSGGVQSWTACPGGASAITGLTGDVTATGPGVVAATLATVNIAPGACGDATDVCVPTTNGKGLVISQTATPLLDCSLSGPLFCANTNATLATALAAAYTYTNTNHASSAVRIAAGNYNITSQFSEPLVGGVGVSLIADPGTVNIYMSQNNGGTPWSAMVYSGATSGSQPYFSIIGINFYCTNSSKSAMNALYGLELLNVKNVLLRQLQVQNCGSSATGGEDIATGGGGVTDETQIFMESITTNYDEGFYTGPAGGAGPTPPANGIDLRGSTGDSVLHSILVRNPQTCGIAIEHKGTGERSTGGIVVDTAHVFGFANLSNPAPYFPSYAYCDHSDFGGDRWVSDEVDSAAISGFLMDQLEVGGVDTNSVQIVSPSFYWFTPFADYSGVPNLMTLTSTAVGNVDVIDPVCTNHPYTSSSGSMYTNSSLITPAFYGGVGCGLQDKNGFANFISPINVGGTNGQNILGDGSLANNYWSMSSSRAAFGFGTNGGAVVHATAGKQITFEIGATYDSGTRYGVFDATNGFMIGGNPQSATAANFRLDYTGIFAQQIATLSASSTIAPTAPITEVSSTATVTTVTAPSPACVNSLGCTIILHSVNGFALGTGGNIASATNVPAGTFIYLTYLPNLSQWSVASGGIAKSPNCSAGSGTKIALTGLAASTGTVNMCTATVSGQYRVTANLYVTTVGTGSNTSSLTLGSNNGAGGSSNFYGPSALVSTALGGQSQAVVDFHTASGQNITYSFSICASCGTPQFGADITVEQLQP